MNINATATTFLIAGALNANFYSSAAVGALGGAEETPSKSGLLDSYPLNGTAVCLISLESK